MKIKMVVQNFETGETYEKEIDLFNISHEIMKIHESFSDIMKTKYKGLTLLESFDMETYDDSMAFMPMSYVVHENLINKSILCRVMFLKCEEN